MEAVAEKVLSPRSGLLSALTQPFMETSSSNHVASYGSGYGHSGYGCNCCCDKDDDGLDGNLVGLLAAGAAAVALLLAALMATAPPPTGRRKRDVGLIHPNESVTAKLFEQVVLPGKPLSVSFCYSSLWRCLAPVTSSPPTALITLDQTLRWSQQLLEKTLKRLIRT